MHTLRSTLLVALCAFVLGCSDGSDTGSPTPPVPPEPPPPPPPTDLESTGVYQGRIVTTSGELALVTFTLARDGQTAIAIQTGNSGATDRVLWGETSAAGGELDFSGSDSEDGAAVELTFSAGDGQLSGEVRLPGLTGDAEAQLTPYSGDTGVAAGSFSRQDSPGGLTTLTIDGESVTVSAPCSGEGTLTTPDTGVNIHRLSLGQDCLGWEALGSLVTLDGGAIVLELSGNDGLTTRLYQP